MDCLQKILFIIPLILNSCATSQVEEEFLQQEEQTAIGFNGKVHNSRALADDLKANGIKVWGGYEGGTVPVFDGSDIVFGTNASYTTNQYWTYNSYNFYAVYPKNTSATYNVANNTFTISNYNVKDNQDVDLLISTVEDHEYPKNGSVVNLNFKHALVQVVVKAKKDEGAGNITVTSVSLYGMPTEGRYSSTSGAWSFSAYSDVDTKFYNSSSFEKELTTSATNMMDALLMFPTSFISTTYMLHVGYKIGGQAFDKDIQLSAASIDKWEAGNVYSYTFTVIDENKIIFDTPKVVPWTASNGNVIIVE